MTESTKHTPQEAARLRVERTIDRRGCSRGTAEGIVIGQLATERAELLEALKGMLEWARRVKVLNPGKEVAEAMRIVEKAEKGA